MNAVMLTVVGSVVSPPAATTDRGGIPVATFRIASTSRRYDRVLGGYTSGATMYLQVQCRRGLAHNVAATLVRGAPVIVQGRLLTRPTVVEGPDGPQRRDHHELEAFAVGLDLARLPLADGHPGERSDDPRDMQRDGARDVGRNDPRDVQHDVRHGQRDDAPDEGPAERSGDGRGRVPTAAA